MTAMESLLSSFYSFALPKAWSGIKDLTLVLFTICANSYLQAQNEIEYRESKDGPCRMLVYIPCTKGEADCLELRGIPMNSKDDQPTTLAWYKRVGSSISTIYCTSNPRFDPSGCGGSKVKGEVVVGGRVKIIEFDFADRLNAPDLTKLELKRGDYYAVWVKNINLNLYKVSLKAADTVSVTAVDFPGFASVATDGLSELVASITNATAAVLNASAPSPSPDKLRDEEKLKLLTLEREINQRIEQEAMKLAEINASIAALNSRLVKLNLDIRTYQMSFKTEFLCGTIYDNLSSRADLESIFNEVNTLVNDIIALQAEVKGKQASYLDFYSVPKHQKVLDGADFKDRDKAIKEAYTKAMSATDDIMKAFDSDKIGAALNALVALENNATLGYRSLPIQYNGGDATVELKIVPIEASSNLTSYEPEPYHFPVRKQNYVGVSPSFYVSDLYDRAYSTQARPVNDTISLYSIVSENVRPKEIGAALKFAFGKTFIDGYNNDLGVHLSIGPGISLTKPTRPRLLCGFGLSYGRNHRVLLDFNWITGFVSRRSSSYQTDHGYREQPTGITIDQLKSGGAITLGYMFEL